MEAIKTYTELRILEEKTVEKQFNLLSLKGMEVKQNPDKHGFVSSIPEISVESYIVDSTDNGQRKAIMTMLSKSPEMLELLLKTANKLESDIQEQKEWQLDSTKEETLLSEIKILLNQIID